MTLELREPFENPFRPGAGQMPPYLAGRETEQSEFKELLTQKVILSPYSFARTSVCSSTLNH